MAKLASTQIEQLREIGAYLRQVRQQQGLAIDDVANQIFIRPALLRAVEEGEAQHLPEPVFVQGFIRRYAEALRLDGHELAGAFTVTHVDVVPETHVSAGLPAGGNPEPERPSPFAPEPPVPERFPSRSRQSGLPLGLIAALIALAAGLGFGLWSLAKRPPAEAGAPTAAGGSSSEPAPAPTPATTPAPTPTPTASAAPAAPAAPVVANLTLSDRAWVSVVADGKKVDEGILENGVAKTYSAKSSLKITSGNAGGVKISFNGSSPVTLGAPGTVRTLTLTPTTDPATLATP